MRLRPLQWLSSRRITSDIPFIELGKIDTPRRHIASPAPSRFGGKGHPRMLLSISICLAFSVLFFILTQQKIDSLKSILQPTWAPWSEYPWRRFPKVEGYYNGIRSTVHVSQRPPEFSSINFYSQSRISEILSSKQPVELSEYIPYPSYNSSEYTSMHHPVELCYIDSDNKILPPNIWAREGLPRGTPEPVFGSYELLGIRNDVCYDRIGRFGPYGFSYEQDMRESAGGTNTEHEGYEEVWRKGGRIKYASIDFPSGLNWGKAQKQCYQANKHRFTSNNTTLQANQPIPKFIIPRQAVVLRSYTGYKWTRMSTLNLRALISELSLKSGGEYEVHILLHVQNETLPIWTDEEVYRQTIQQNTPPEFWDLVTLWSVPKMTAVYSTPFGVAFENPSSRDIHGAHRSQHMPLSLFALEHPEFEHIWNLEMDMRYTGHYYELLDRIGRWSRDQPRKGLLERNAKYWIPNTHGSWQNFTDLVELENPQEEVTPPDKAKVGQWYGYPVDFPGKILLDDNVPTPPPGCSPDLDGSLCGVGEDADLITFNPIFNPENSGWDFAKDITGYDLNLPIPPRRTSIVSAGRLSRKLLMTMHDEMSENGHSAFVEMFPPTLALHHGLKAVYVPHPVFFEQKWPLEEVEKKFNGGMFGSTGGNKSSPFKKKNEHNHRGTTFYYNSEFAGRLWRRWLGYKENGEGGRDFENNGSGRMCLQGVLLHPIKYEAGNA